MTRGPHNNRRVSFGEVCPISVDHESAVANDSAAVVTHNQTGFWLHANMAAAIAGTSPTASTCAPVRPFACSSEMDVDGVLGRAQVPSAAVEKKKNNKLAVHTGPPAKIPLPTTTAAHAPLADSQLLRQAPHATMPAKVTPYSHVIG